MVATVTESSNVENSDVISSFSEKTRYSWPTISLFIIIVMSFIVATTLSINEKIPIIAAMFVNFLVSYIAYTIAHESAHGLICKNKYLNNIMGVISLFFITIMPFLSTYRFLHMTHHRYANVPDKDPDYFCALGPKWALPFRWIFMDIAYVTNYFKMGYYPSRPVKEKLEFWFAVFFGLILLSLIIANGYFLQFVLLYYIPTRIALFFLVLLFDYLPHYPHKATNLENKYLATNNRVGLEWLLTPLFLGQNYHLSHHISPNVPFYRYRKVWQSRQAFHKSFHPNEVPYYRMTAK